MNRAVVARMTEAELQENVRRMCLTLTILHYHPHDSRRSAPGWPDSTCLGRRGLLFRELKRQDGRVTPEQRAWGYAMQDLGYDWKVWRPADWLDGTIEAELRAIA